MSEADADPWEGDCPYCDTSTGHLNNHIRPTDGNGHGPAGQYPDDWDKENREVIDPAEADDSEDGEGVTLDPESASDDDDDELTIEAGDTGPRSYECPECNVEVEYGTEECENDHTQEWHE
jgi:hypothetical protein